MARNASDIFCLNEDNTDGTQMFSVNGSCPLKIARRTRPRENDCFEYGRSRSPERMDEGGEAPRYPQGRMEGGDPLGVYEEEARSPIRGSEAKKDGGDSAARLEEGAATLPAPEGKPHHQAPRRLYLSSMQRNPLTGAGMETQEHKKSKKGPSNKEDGWVW